MATRLTHTNPYPQNALPLSFILLIGHKADHMTRDRVRTQTVPISAVKEMTVLKNGKMAGHYYYQFLRESAGGTS